METARVNGSNGKQEEVKTTTSPKKEAEEGKKSTSPIRGEKDVNKNNASPSLETGQLKNSVYSGGDWKRPIIQFVESSDEKRSTYFNVEPAEAKKPSFPNMQLGETRRPPVSFPERGDLRKSIYNVETKKTFISEGDVKKPLFSSGQIADLRKPNISLGDLGEAKRSSYNRVSRGSSSRPRVNLEEVLCDSCIDNKQKAVKSCLVCQASFCELHLKPHLEGAAFRDHQLLDPIRDFEARKCPVHGKTMELFCQTDQVCICYLCMFQEHKNHTTVTVEVEKSGKETELSLQKEQLQLKIIELEDEVDKWHKERDRIKNFTANEKSTVDQHFKELIRDLEKQREEVKAGLDHREKVAMENIKEIVEELEERAKLLQEDKDTREQISQISDSVLFLQEFGAMMRSYTIPPSLPTYSILLEGENMSPAMGILRDDLLNVCMRHVEKVCKADLSRNFIERNHMENELQKRSAASGQRPIQSGIWIPPTASQMPKDRKASHRGHRPLLALSKGDHRFMMNNYSDWNQPDNLKRFSMFLTPKGGNYNTRAWEFSSMQSAEETLSAGNSAYSLKAYPSIVRHQTAKAQPQSWKSSKQNMLSHYRPFYVNKGNGVTSNEAP
ncbi:tripartite motif-containing protein 29 isoform X2 [Rhineura floridana]|uniref:tripartite motif-containing protein 29 isoform X2 n=1 Tax=Rhineura floridana TaxID=261503 RepID=UPI002AC88836|nr:tripartite motif-containing protein 29 isoform X2 [Rhineura floridana]